MGKLLKAFALLCPYIHPHEDLSLTLKLPIARREAINTFGTLWCGSNRWQSQRTVLLDQGAIQLQIILKNKHFLCLLYSLLICLIFSSEAYNRDQTEYFRNTLACASWAKMRSPRARNCCRRSSLDPKSKPLFKVRVLEYLSPEWWCLPLCGRLWKCHVEHRPVVVWKELIRSKKWL